MAEPDQGGNSSETVAMGKVVDGNGNSVMGAWVALVPADFNPITQTVPSALTTTTDAKGEFSIPKVPRGHYGMEAKHSSDGTRLFTGGLELLDATSSIPADTLRKAGRLRVRLPDYFKQAGGYVFLPHTRYALPVTGTSIEHGYVDFDSLPAASYDAVAFSADTGISAPDTLGRRIDILPGDSLSVGAYAGWGKMSKVTINTSASGGLLDVPVTGFPLLVRLNAANFDFASVSADGADIRVSKADGSPLAYQIDHWDAVKKEAALWVAMDTVQADNAGQYFLLHWGKPGAASRSDGPAVFAGIGFAAAWHLDEEAAGTGTAGLYRNSAGDADNGLDSLTSTDQGGVIGNGHYFNHGDYIRVPSATDALKPAGPITLSAWVKPTAIDSSGTEIASMGNDYGIRAAWNKQAFLFSFNIPSSDSSNSTLYSTGVNLLDGDWHFIAGIVNGTGLDLYVDGNYNGGVDNPKGQLKYNGGPDFFIGHHGNGEERYD